MSRDAARIAQRARDLLPLTATRLPDVYYYNSITLCVLDAVFSIGALYESTEAVVKKYCQFYGVKRIRPDRSVLPAESSQEPASALVQRVEERGALRFATSVVRNSQRTSARGGILKAEAAAAFAKTLVGYGVEYLQDLPPYEEEGALETALRGVHGQGSGISTGYFWMLAGSDQLIKPDRMILGFIQDTLGRSLTTAEARSLLAEATEMLASNFPHLTPRLLDYEIWQFQRARRASDRSKVGSARLTDDGPTLSGASDQRSNDTEKGQIATASVSDGNDTMTRHVGVSGMPRIGAALERAGRELQPIYAPNAIPARELVERAAVYASCSPTSVLPADFAYDRVNKGAVSRAYPMFIGAGRGYWRFVGLDHPYTGPIFWKPLGETDRQVGLSTNGRAVFTYDPRKNG